MADKKYVEESAPHPNAEMPKGAKGGNFSQMKTLETTNPTMKKEKKGGSKDRGEAYNTDNPKGTERAHRGDGVGKNPAHGY